mmetsp:Transcript_45165/g.130410  ORF Transcript_45165/g.130410 Transcript_45165/m.130410 type:complete len:246 (-) Transcript_45165:914-1651(-)
MGFACNTSSNRLVSSLPLACKARSAARAFNEVCASRPSWSHASKAFSNEPESPRRIVKSISARSSSSRNTSSASTITACGTPFFFASSIAKRSGTGSLSARAASNSLCDFALAKSSSARCSVAALRPKPCASAKTAGIVRKVTVFLALEAASSRRFTAARCCSSSSAASACRTNALVVVWSKSLLRSMAVCMPAMLPRFMASCKPRDMNSICCIFSTAAACGSYTRFGMSALLHISIVSLNSPTA